MKPVKFEPISQYVWVYHEDQKKEYETTKSGLITSTETKKEKNVKRVVAAVGALCDPEVKKTIRPGDTILFENLGRGTVTLEGQEFYLVQDRHVMCKTSDERVSFS